MPTDQNEAGGEKSLRDILGGRTPDMMDALIHDLHPDATELDEFGHLINPLQIQK